MSSSIKFKNPFKRFMKDKQSAQAEAPPKPAEPKQEEVAAHQAALDTPELPKQVDEKTISNNPYIQSINLYQSLYGGVYRSLQSARRLNKWFLGIILFLLVSVVYLGGQSKIIPYVTNIQDGQIIYGELMQQSNFERYKNQFKAYFLEKFIQSARTVSSDAGVNSSDRRQAYALVRDNASEQLSSFYDRHEPNIIGASETKEVHINYLYPMANTDNAMEAGWTEITHQAKTGKITGRQAYKGVFIYTFATPSQSMDILRRNPFGFYVTSFHWTSLTSIQGVN